MKYKKHNQYNPMYMPQQYFQMQPQMVQQQQIQMIPQAYVYAQQQGYYQAPIGGSIPNPRIAMQASPMPPAMNFRHAYDIINRKGEFKKLSKPDRQEILKNMLVAKLKTNKNSEL